MSERQSDRINNKLTVDSTGIIIIVLRGKQTASSVKMLVTEVAKQTTILRDKNKKVLLLSDIRELNNSDTPSGARLEIKKLLSIPADASVVLGGRGILRVAMYLVRTGSANARVRYFSDERKARSWLERTQHSKYHNRTSVSLVAGSVIGLIGILALIGIRTHNPYLVRGLPTLRPMNPLAAVGLMAIGYGFICYYFDRLRQLKIVGLFGVSLGVAALLLHVDHALPGHGPIFTGRYSQPADSAAVCFIAVGVSPFTVGTKRKMVRVFQYALGGLIVGLSLLNIFGQLYDPQFIGSVNNSFVMSFNLALAFLIVGGTLILITLYRQVGDVIGTVPHIAWLVVIALIFVQVFTYGAWSQAVTHNKANATQAFTGQGKLLEASLRQRIQAYTNALYGFRGLFMASNYVDQAEFQSYYNSLNSSTAYPGVRAVSFITKVQEKNLQAFVANRRSDTSLYAGGNPNFAVTAKSNAPTHYILTYLATSTAVTGSDLGSNPARLAAFQKAAALDTPVSSGTVQFPAVAGATPETGFFITIPVSTELGSGSQIGFVNTVFNYHDFFAHAFAPATLLKGLNMSIIDTMDNTVVATSFGADITNDTTLSQTVNIPVADHTWSVRLSAPSGFGLDEDQDVLPATILIGGQLFAVLLIVIFMLQTRSRRQGFDLASDITKDLEHERNQAVANDHKSNAILESIGDAVFAIDTDQRITLFNPSAERISGYSQAEALGKRYDEILQFEFEKTGRPNDHFVRSALAGHLASMANHTLLIRKDGRRVAVADSAAPIQDATHKTQGAIIVFRDVSKEAALDKAEAEFVSLASHQLRTPLSAITWYGEMLLDGDAGKLTTDQREYVTEIFEGNQRMIALVNSLLDVSRLELGKLSGTPESTDVASLVASLEKELAVDVKTKQLVITKKIAAIAPVMADPKQLRMVIQNLLSNAVKYTPENGAVTVCLRKATPADLAGTRLNVQVPRWYFSVEDTGYGIPVAQQPKIFGKLFRADNARKLDVEGTGLGLYIVKEVVEKLGGRVWFESMESVGTTFHVVLPFK